MLGILLLDFGVQAMHVTNQSQIYALPGDARSRITSAYMTAYFAGGALGSAAVSVAASRWGWTGVCTVGAGFALLQLLTAALRPRESSQAIGALSVCSQDKNLWSLGESLSVGSKRASLTLMTVSNCLGYTLSQSGYLQVHADSESYVGCSRQGIPQFRVFVW